MAVNVLSILCRIQRSLKKQGVSFSSLKNHFSPKTHGKHLKHLDKPIHNLNKKKLEKTIKSNPKTFSQLDLPHRVSRRKKQLGETLLIKWNSLTSILTILTAQIIVNNHFISLHRNSTILSLPSNKKKKIEK
jgi:hypothetical protein